ncbi:MAG: amidohydrolase family protein [Armatimonadetes bacterium]|nr:amidohydrolase family protein [Armatimonadota bacterium]
MEMNKETKGGLMDKVRRGIPLNDLLVIDAHCHMGRWHNFNIPKGDAAGMIEMMDRLGIRSCIVAHHSAIGPDFRYGNDEVLSAMAKFPKRIYGYATVNPNYPEAELVAELERCISAGMVGVKIHPDVHQCNVDDEKYRPVWEWANERRLPLLSHTSTGGRNPVKTFEKLAEMYPNVSIILGHSGFGSEGANQSIQAALKYPNINLELTGSVIVYGTLERMVKQIGAERVLFGTDIPFLDARPQIGRVAFAKISEEDKQKILGLNAARIFGI